LFVSDFVKTNKNFILIQPYSVCPGVGKKIIGYQNNSVDTYQGKELKTL